MLYIILYVKYHINVWWYLTIYHINMYKLYTVNLLIIIIVYNIAKYSKSPEIWQRRRHRSSPSKTRVRSLAVASTRGLAPR